MSFPAAQNPSLLPDLGRVVAWAEVQNREPLELSKPHSKELHSIGHKAERFLAAQTQWGRHAAKLGQGALPAWVRGLPVELPGELAEQGLFACGLRLSGEGLHLWNLLLPQNETVLLAKIWQQADPAAPQSLPVALSSPKHANAPLWIALLRLRPLRDFWDRELRRATVDTLLRMLPEAWVLDPTPVPPGAVIPRLGVNSWSEMPRHRQCESRFAIVPPQALDAAVILEPALPLADWQSALKRALGCFDQQPQVLLRAHGGDSTAPLLIAFYEKKEGRVNHMGTLGLVPCAEGGLAPARIVRG